MNDSDSYLIKAWDDLPKYLIDGITLKKSGYEEEVLYRLTIVKKDWDGHPDAVIIRYAKEWKQAYGKSNPIIEVTGSNLLVALSNIKAAVEHMKSEGIIKGKTIMINKYIELNEFNCTAGVNKRNPKRNTI